VEYREVGCNVYGAGWVDIGRFDENDIHFFADDGKLIPSKHGFHLCVGTPESFPMMQNVILENVRTADNMLVAYERVMVGASNKVELIAYAHGNEGRKQFSHNKSRFISKR
jgi:hypothetical protein